MIKLSTTKSTAKIDIKVSNADDSLKIYINSVLHLCLKRSSLTGFQSWLCDNKDGDTIHYIEYTVEGKNITTEYTSRSLWENILSSLNKQKVFTTNI